MPSAADIALAIGPPVLAYIIGWFSPRVRQQVRTRRARLFWRPFSTLDHLRVISGGHLEDSFEGWEASGLVGFGDVRALTELQEIFFENDLGRLPSTFSTRPDLTLIKDADLILIGGPDVNWVTLEMISRRPGRFRLGDAERHIISIEDRARGISYGPSPRKGGGIERDVGVIKMMPNPLSGNNRVLIIAGAFGYGTLAGVQLIREKTFLQHPFVSDGNFFECLFQTEIIGDEPLPAKILEFQPIDAE